ncbi:MAG: iron donor protein CyaY [Alphaproteobacteria bacterium]
MTDRDFAARADRALADLMDRIETALDDADVDLTDGILTVELADGATFVVNKHAPNREVWLSSPRSGAWHFAWDEGRSAWVSTRGPETLHGVLSADLAIALE